MASFRFSDRGDGHDIFCAEGEPHINGGRCNCSFLTQGTPLSAGSVPSKVSLQKALVKMGHVLNQPSAFNAIPTQQTIYDTSATLPEVKSVDPAEQKLLDKVLPKFRGEARCQPPKPPQGYPREPYFRDNSERNQQSFKAVKRYLSVAMREWPICRHSREPLELRIEGATMKDDPYGGEYARPTFYCATCGVYG